jgi:hypothetical protein
MLNLDLRKIVTTVHEDVCDNKSPIVAQYKWGDNERVYFCDTVKEMEEVAKQKGFRESNHWVIQLAKTSQSMPYDIIHALELAAWRSPETVALVKINPKSMHLWARSPFDCDKYNLEKAMKKSQERYSMYLNNVRLYHCFEDFLKRNYLSGWSTDSYVD